MADEFESKEERDRRDQLKGYQPKFLPGMPPNHRVVGRDRNGRPVTVGEVEKVFNDAFLIDYVKGQGTYLKHTGSRQEDVLRIAIQLYTAGLDAEDVRKLVLV